MDRFRVMESFVRVVRAGSFTVAAHQLGLSRALVSRQIGDLEARLGVRLLNRTTRSLSLTEEGRHYLDFCERMFRDIESSERAITGARSEPAGTLRLAAPKSFGTAYLSDAIIAFAKAYPRLRVSLELENTSLRRSHDFIERGLDLALCISSRSAPAIAGREIAMVDWSVCAAPDYLDRAEKLTSPADLARHACLVHLNAASNDHVWRFEGAKGPMSVKVRGAFHSNSALVLRKAALAGLGVAMVPHYSVAEDVEQGRLVAVLPRYRVASRPLLAIYPRTAATPRKIEAFVDFLADWMASNAIGHRPASRRQVRLAS
ncbi:MAG: LysR substrate-binding domain-containing protein [Pseudolabrys sp.]